MEYAQERIATLHDLTGRTPAAPTDRACVVVPMTEREHASLATERVLTELQAVDPARVIVALRAPPDRIADFREWLDGFDLPLEALWCTAAPVQELLAEHGLDGPAGKGRDVWLALGPAAADHPYVACHDADTKTFAADYVHRLLSPLERGFSFSKGYYARVEGNRLYGRLCRLFYTPLVRALRRERDAPILQYLDAFRYALAGEFGLEADLARRVRVERRFGLEVGLLGEAFEGAGFEGTAQVDLGRYEHDHRAVGGPNGLTDMGTAVGDALFRLLAERGVTPDYGALPERYREVARSLVRQYEADAAYNGLDYDAADELSQVDAYAETIRPPSGDDRLPAWADAPIDPDEVLRASREGLADVG